jgi:O-glycosyl hydrolase
VRVETSGKAKGVRVMTFQTPEGGYVAQLMNSLKTDQNVSLVSMGRTLQVKLPARSITTATW